jgi:hypothetical protein
LRRTKAPKSTLHERGDANGNRDLEIRRGCPYRKSNPHVLMVQPTKDGPHFDAPGALNDPSNRRILA